MNRCAVALLTLLLSACTAVVYAPQPLTLPTAIEDLHTQSTESVTVSVGILSDEQSMDHFGIDLGEEICRPSGSASPTGQTKSCG